MEWPTPLNCRQVLLVNLLWNVIIMVDYLYILIVVLVLAWLWKKFKKHMTTKQHNENNGGDEALSNVVTEEDFDTEPAASVAEDADYLLLALDKGNEAQIAMREKNNTEAWALLQAQKQFYSKYTASQSAGADALVALDSHVSKDLANLLRQEKKHKDALVHIIYWVGNSQSVTKDQHSKLRAYVNRAKLSGITVDDAMDYCLVDGVKQFHMVQKDVDSWD